MLVKDEAGGSAMRIEGLVSVESAGLAWCLGRTICCCAPVRPVPTGTP
jgi:hypothetical protein